MVQDVSSLGLRNIKLAVLFVLCMRVCVAYLCVYMDVDECWPGQVVGCLQIPGWSGNREPQSEKDGGSAHSGWWWSDTPGWSEPSPHPPHPSDLQPQADNNPHRNRKWLSTPSVNKTFPRVRKYISHFTLSDELLKQRLSAVLMFSRGWCPCQVIQVVKENNRGLHPLCLFKNVVQILSHSFYSFAWKQTK